MVVADELVHLDIAIRLETGTLALERKVLRVISIGVQQCLVGFWVVCLNAIYKLHSR
jgi:hypothetical protein